MAGGPIFPRSAFPLTSDTFANFHVGAGANSKQEEGLGVRNSLTSDATWRLRFQMPPQLPSGTPKLRLRTLVGTPSGNKVANVNAKWASVAAGEDPSAVALNAEGTTAVTFTTLDGDKYVETTIVLDADTIVAGEEVVMDLVFEQAGWTLDLISTWIVSILWE